MSSPDDGDICDAFVPFDLRDINRISKAVGPPIVDEDDENIGE